MHAFSHTYIHTSIQTHIHTILLSDYSLASSGRAHSDGRNADSAGVGGERPEATHCDGGDGGGDVACDGGQCGGESHEVVAQDPILLVILG